MPLYEYVCETCGPFAAMRPLAAFAEPYGCPDCGTASPRNLLASPALGGTGGAAAAVAPAATRPAHAGSCACCKPSRGFRAEAVS
jgi:putative FmdB family regulatory protein